MKVYHFLDKHKGSSNLEYVGRPRASSSGDEDNFHFGNPFSHLRSGNMECPNFGDRDQCVQAYEDWLLGVAHQQVNPARRKWILDNLHTLKGKDLVCWCAPLRCHAEVLLKMANKGELDMNIVAYTDGSCKGNPGPGGWAYKVMYKHPKLGQISKTKGGHLPITTNNQAELQAPLNMLRDLLPNPNGDLNLHVVSDSKLVIGWCKGEMKINVPEIQVLVSEIQQLIQQKNINITWEWVKGHDKDVHNTEVDALAQKAAITPNGA